MNASDFYTCSTAAAELGVTPTPVRALIAANRLRATLVGHVWLIEPAALDTVRSRKSGRPPSKTNAAV
jgi:excisionase family DNA binding protein